MHHQKEFNRNYDPVEDAERKEIFKGTLQRITEHNEKGEHSTTLGINQFADEKPEEYRRLLGALPINRPFRGESEI